MSSLTTYVSNCRGSEQSGADNVLTPITKTNMPINTNGYLYIYVSIETANIPVYTMVFICTPLYTILKIPLSLTIVIANHKTPLIVTNLFRYSV